MWTDNTFNFHQHSRQNQRVEQILHTFFVQRKHMLAPSLIQLARIVLHRGRNWPVSRYNSPIDPS